MNLRDTFLEAVRGASFLPASLREHATEVRGLEERRLDPTYIEFLETQIELKVRGPEWTDRLKRRLAALLPFCGFTLLSGNVHVGDTYFTMEIDPLAKAVVHWERYD